MEEVRQFFSEGGAFMWLNVALGLLSVGLAAERGFRLLFVFGLRQEAFMQKIRTYLSHGNVNRARMLAQASPPVPIVQVVRRALSRAGEGEAEVAKAVKEALLEFTPPIRARVAWLWSLATLAVLVGAMGGLSGFLGAVRASGDLLHTSDVTVPVGHAIFGFAIASACVVFHLLLSSYGKKLVHSIELHALKVEHLLTERSPAPVTERETPHLSVVGR